MTELDFDELDKAVNSLMSDVEKTSNSSGSTSSASSTVATPSEPTAKPATDTPSPSEPLIPNKPTSSPLTTKRRGQFMDVIRPSSSASKPTNLNRHQGITLAPVANPTSTEDTPSTSSDLSESASTTPSPAKEESKNAWPDPIDLATEPKEPVDVSNSESSVETTDTPLESPFLPDAKPEKRPLGGGQSESDIHESPTDDFEPKKSASEPEPTPLVTSTPNAPLPEELHTNLVAIESESTVITEPVSTEATAESSVQTVETDTAATPEVATVQPEAEVPAGGSIAQQYKEAPSSGDQTNGSIYDTANYHKAIEAHATGGKKSSVLKWVMWVVLLLILGIGGGAAAFMLTR